MEELKETVKEEFMPWVSQYLVMKRVSIEPNFHSLYSNFLDTLKNLEFNKMVLNETYRNIKVSSASFLKAAQECAVLLMLFACMLLILKYRISFQNLFSSLLLDLQVIFMNTRILFS